MRHVSRVPILHTAGSSAAMFGVALLVACGPKPKGAESYDALAVHGKTTLGPCGVELIEAYRWHGEDWRGAARIELEGDGCQARLHVVSHKRIVMSSSAARGSGPHMLMADHHKATAPPSDPTWLLLEVREGGLLSTSHEVRIAGEVQGGPTF